MSDDNISEAIKALIKAQSEMGVAIKSAINPHFKSKYADLQSVVDATMAAFHANGFAVLQKSGKDDLGHFVNTQIMHSSGSAFSSNVYLELNKKDMQAVGAAITYARRYGLLGMAGIAPEDDDGETAVGRGKWQQPAKPEIAVANPIEMRDALLEYMESKTAEELIDKKDDLNKRFKKVLARDEPKGLELIACYNVAVGAENGL